MSGQPEAASQKRPGEDNREPTEHRPAPLGRWAPKERAIGFEPTTFSLEG